MDGYVAVQGDHLVDPAGRPLTLRGVNIGGWMLMEGFIGGFPGNESGFRRRLGEALGEARAERFFDRWLDAWFTEDDARFVASLGANCVRIPINYRHFEDDLRPFELREQGLARLDRAIEWCAHHGLYVIIDLHAAQGWQNGSWHSDNPSRLTLLWEQRQFQDRVTWLWEQLARHYRDAPWVAGYNLLNEPVDVQGGHRLMALYARLGMAIRSIDPHHVLFLDGNRYAQQPPDAGIGIGNVVHAIHHYPVPGTAGSSAYPGVIAGRTWDRAAVKGELLTRVGPSLDAGVPVLLGEFGPIYDDDPAMLASRLRVLDDQLGMFEELGLSWTIWTLKDVGVHALLEVGPETPWRRLMQPMIDRTQRLGAQYWGVSPATWRSAFGDLYRLVEREFEDLPWYPWEPANEIQVIVGENMIGAFLARQAAESFRDLDDAALDALSGSFRFASCIERTALVERLRSVLHGTRPRPAPLGPALLNA